MSGPNELNGVERRDVLRGAGGMVALPLNILPDWFSFGDDGGESDHIAVAKDEEKDEYDPDEYALFVATDAELIYRPEDGEWTVWKSAGSTPVFNSDGAGSVDSQGRWNGGVVLEGGTETSKTPGTPGALFWDTNRKVLGMDDGEDFEFGVLGGDVLTESETVADTLTETTVYSASLDENSMVAGRVYEVFIRGRYSSANTSDTFTFRFNIGGTEVSVTQSAGENATDAPFQLKLEATVRSDGIDGTLMAYTHAHFNDSPQSTPGNGAVSVDTQSVTEISGTVTWSAADPGNTVTVEQGYVKEMA